MTTMTDNEIIKALECCVSDGGCIPTGCPMINECRIDIKSAEKYAIYLISRQKAEIERLQGCVKSEEEVREIMKSQMIPMVKEVVNEQFDVAVKLARAEAIKEFADRLKEKLGNTDLAIRFIDNLVKEMVGADND